MTDHYQINKYKFVLNKCHQAPLTDPADKTFTKIPALRAIRGTVAIRAWTPAIAA